MAPPTKSNNKAAAGIGGGGGHHNSSIGGGRARATPMIGVTQVHTSASLHASSTSASTLFDEPTKTAAGTSYDPFAATEEDDEGDANTSYASYAQSVAAGLRAKIAAKAAASSQIPTASLGGATNSNQRNQSNNNNTSSSNNSSGGSSSSSVHFVRGGNLNM